MSAPYATVSNHFVIRRLFDASRDRVWKAWTECELLQQWFGPRGVTITACTLDLRPGGAFHYCMTLPDGKEMWGKWVFHEITAPERIVAIVMFSDALGAVTRHPMSETWPLETHSTTIFEERDGKTQVTIEWAAHHPTDAERETFNAGHDSMEIGWSGTLDHLAEYLAKA